MIQHHFDGHGLNEAIEITHDDVGPGNAHHRYDFDMTGPFAGTVVVGTLQFQKGPRLAEGSTPGVTDAAVLAVVVDRYEGFQAGPFASPQGDEVLVHLRAALALMKARADERARRGVLGRNER